MFGMHRAGSMFIFDRARELAKLGAFRFRSPNTGDQSANRPETWRKRGYCYGPLRGLPEGLSPSSLDDFQVILFLRDPRDVVVSAYFAAAYYHEVTPANSFLYSFSPAEGQREQWQKEGIDSFVLSSTRDNPFRTSSILERYEAYCNVLLGRPNVTFLTYEEMVTSVETWLAKLVVPFGISITDPACQAILQRCTKDFTVSDEDVLRHKRQIRPGDHLRKLKPATVEVLNSKFRHVMDKLQQASVKKD